MSKNPGTHALWLAASMASAVCAYADTAEEANKSNNPLNLAPGANLQDDTPRLSTPATHCGAERRRLRPTTSSACPQFTLFAGINVTFGK